MPGEHFECFPVPEEYQPWEASVTTLKGGAILLVFSSRDLAVLLGMTSKDLGRTWEGPFPLRTGDGKKISGWRSSLIRLRSGALGLFHSAPRLRSGRDGCLMFHSSKDEGTTWSDGVLIDPYFAILRNGCGLVLEDGRVLVPAYLWFSSHLRDAEQIAASLCYSFTYFSDDEGMSWQRSENELVIRENDVTYEFVDNRYFRMTEDSRSQVTEYHRMDMFGEPTAAELNDGRILLLGRTRLGRPFKSTSGDGGASWTRPEPVDIASSSSPQLLLKVPSTGDLLLIWNQASEEEMLSGLHRHRLSTAISRDGGKTWQDFRNLESMDDVSRIEPPPVKIYQMADWLTGSYREPADRKRYHRRPGYLRAAYPAATFVADNAVVCYDCGRAADASGAASKVFQTKVKVVPVKWFYGA